ncbi:MAG: beta-ketoacyl synthase N-terminal-like domain-containing protein [Planctomycetota bacterium]|jgi:3-oxoacyl-[acyl-carrier-protein] synthase II
MTADVVITGVGMLTPLGQRLQEILDRIYSCETAATKPVFDVTKFYCPVCAPVPKFDGEQYFPENKTLRLMNRDAQMAVAAARLAMDDACIESGATYPAENIALFGSTGTAGMSVEEIERIIQYAANDDGSLSLERFGRVALRRVRPVLSFRILANMPICFVSIFENIRGPNAVYTPWEGHGAHALAAGIRAIKRGNVPCALVGGCDVKCRELSFVCLQQLGIFESWKQYGNGSIPGEGAAFVALEEEAAATRRGVTPYARIRDCRIESMSSTSNLADTMYSTISELRRNDNLCIVVGSGDGDVAVNNAEARAFERAGLEYRDSLRPKSYVGNLFAAASAVQVGLAAQLTRQQEKGQSVMANCFGYGSEKAAFVLEAV